MASNKTNDKMLYVLFAQASPATASNRQKILLHSFQERSKRFRGNILRRNDINIYTQFLLKVFSTEHQTNVTNAKTIKVSSRVDTHTHAEREGGER